ncbi:MAG: ribbon-helix-helix protein, CopG family [Porticoccaceae bacterium]|mgnify:CR=1 FL=1|nr:ribbon-helix-helix protein, CopG family [Porticoccaceae bacterium]
MATAKTTTLTFRIEPELKEALRTAAKQEHRSITNMVEVLIREYCGRNDIPVELTQASGRKGAAKFAELNNE